MKSKRSLLVGLALMLAACRSTNVSPIDEARRALELEQDERKMWTEAQHIEKLAGDSGLIYTNVALEAYIHSVAVKLAGERLKDPAAEVKIHILRQPYRNASMLPNGAFYITTGMLASMDNEAELAFLVGHELTHFLGRHALKGSRNAANKRIWANVFVGTTILTGLTPVFIEVGSSWATASSLRYSRELETEADEQGLEELVRVGYDPSAALKMLERLREEDEMETVKANKRYSTHPLTQERLDRCRLFLGSRYAEAVGETNRRVEHVSYVAQIRQVLLDNAALDITEQRYDFAQRAVDKHLAVWPDSAHGYFWRGAICQRQRNAESPAQAETAYREAVRLDPKYAEPHRELGLIYQKSGRLKEARDEFAAYVALVPEAIDGKIFQRYITELDVELNRQPTH